MSSCRVVKAMAVEVQAVPNLPILLAALKACKGCRDIEKIRSIHTTAVDTGLLDNVYLASSLVDMYAKCNRMDEAYNVFRGMKHRDVVTWNALIFGYADNGEDEVALDMFGLMSCSCCEPDARTFTAVLKACTGLATREEHTNHKLGYLQKGMAVHCQAAHRRCVSIFMDSTLVDLYAKCGSMTGAQRIFDSMECRNMVSWNALMFGYVEEGEEHVALELYQRMLQEGCKVNDRTFLAALRACNFLAAKEIPKKLLDDRVVKVGSLEKGMSIHAQVTSSGRDFSVYIQSNMVDLYAKCGCIELAQRVFDKVDQPDVVCWTCLIFGYAENGQGHLGLEAFDKMKKAGCSPSAPAFAGAIKACGTSADLKAGKQIHADAVACGIGNDALIKNSLLDLYGKCGTMEDAEHLFALLETKDVVAWNTLIAGYSRQGDIAKVFETFERMVEFSQRWSIAKPNGITLLSVLAACSHAGLVAKGKEYFASMTTSYGMKPEISHYRCMIDLLGRAGELEEALAMVRNMPFPADVMTWKTVLSACHKWRNVELGTMAYQTILDLGGEDPAAHVLVSNLYRSSFYSP